MYAGNVGVLSFHISALISCLVTLSILRPISVEDVKISQVIMRSIHFSAACDKYKFTTSDLHENVINPDRNVLIN
ncbi:hypothetical protein QTP88_012761 [Uroleucon formosanum]